MPTISGEQTHHHHRHYLSRNQRKVVLFFLKCVIMLIVFSLFLFFLGFAAIVLFHFLIMSNTFSRRRRLCHRNAAVENPPPSQLLPNVSYKSADFPTTSDCAICLDSFIDGEECRNLPVCKHLFHSRCVDRWIGKRPTCPVCRTRVDLDPDGLSDLGGVDRWKRLWAAVDYEEGSSN